MSLRKITLADVEKARGVLRGFIATTPIQELNALSVQMRSRVFVKFENQQLTGSFKIRGAFNKVQALNPEEKKRGVICSSAGNHAQGVALACKHAGVRAHIVMPKTTPLVKINATLSHGAEVILEGDFYDEAYAHARALEKEKGYVFVHPYQDPLVMAGQGTIGLELLEALPELETVVIPIGGGGLISGIATVLKTLKPSIRIIGVVSDQAPGMKHLYYSVNAPARQKKISTIAEGIAVKNTSPEMFEVYIKHLVDEIVEVSDDDISQAIVYLLENSKTVVEGSGAAGLAALMKGGLKLGAQTCVLLCGGNIDLNIVAKVIERGQRREHRLARVTVIADDMPGNLHRLTGVFAELRANILEVQHDRVSPDLGVRETRIDFLVEISSDEHLGLIREQISKIIGIRLT